MSTIIRTYKTYSFRDKDPVVDQLRMIVRVSGASYSQIEAASRVSATTLYNWFHGKTRRPQSASIEAVGRACGWKREWSKAGGTAPIVVELKKGAKRRRKSNGK